MTHTLHRYGSWDREARDYVVLAMPAAGFDPERAVAGEKAFLRMAISHGAVNLGDTSHGGCYHARHDLGPAVHWRRGDGRSSEDVVERVDGPSVVSAVFDELDAVCGLLADLKEADLGLSVNLSAPVEVAKEVCRRVGLTRHSVEYSLGFLGGDSKLPREDVLQLCTMCGHGMVSANLARKMVDWVRTGRRRPREAAETMARFCNCGIFNVARAERILAPHESASSRTVAEESAS